MLTGGHLIVLTEEGELALVRADPTSYQEFARFPAIEGRTRTAMSDGILLICNVEEIAACGLRKQGGHRNHPRGKTLVKCHRFSPRIEAFSSQSETR